MKIINSNNLVAPIKRNDVSWVDIPDFQPTSTQDLSLKTICSYGGADKHLFEFGTWVGRSALAFSQNYNTVTTMDYIQGSDINYKYNFAGEECAPGELALKKSNVTLIQENSLNYNFDNFENKFDVVYVDGNHSEEGCYSDLHNSMLISKPRSIIFIDDYANKTMGVYRAVDKFDHPNKFYAEDINLVILVNK